MFLKNIKFAYKTRRAWFYTATSRTKARFARTTLGSFWLGLSNLLSIATLGLVYGTVFKVEDLKSYFIYLGVGLILWNSISSSISNSPYLFSHNSSNIRNMNLNALFYTLEEWAFQIQTFFQSFILVFFVLSFLDRSVLLNFIFASWIPLLNFVIFLYWFPLLICLICVRFTDLAQLVPILLQLVFLISPILYRKESLGNLSWITNFNFIFKILDPLRLSIINGYVFYGNAFFILLINIIGLLFSFWYLEQEGKKLPFLV